MSTTNLLIIENIILTIVAGLLAWFVNPWCLLIMLFINTKIPAKMP